MAAKLGHHTDGFVEADGRAIDAGARQRVEHVIDRCDPRLLWDLRTAEAAG